MAGTIKISLALCCVGLVTACKAQSSLPPAEANIVVRAELGQFCSIIIENPGQPGDGHIRRLLSYVDDVRRYSQDIAASYLEMKSASTMTLTAPGPCAAGKDWVDEARQRAQAMGLRASAAFTPSVRALSDGGASPSRLSTVVQSINGPNSSLAACTISIQLSPSSSAESDRRFHATLAKARDQYGVPILFSAQEGLTLYVSLYRQCEDRAAVFPVLKMISATDPSHGVEMLSYERTTDQKLKEVYGSVF